MLSTQAPPLTGAPQLSTVVGELLAKIRSKSGAPPENAIPVATSVSVCPATQHGPAAGEPWSAPLFVGAAIGDGVQAPGDTQSVFAPQGFA